VFFCKEAQKTAFSQGVTFRFIFFEKSGKKLTCPIFENRATAKNTLSKIVE
jgi:hypothetical protein